MFSKGSVLVVDDEINLCRILGAKLAKSGYSVIAVHDGQQAIDKIRETSFDVVLLDLILPKIDGLSALAEIRTFDKNLPVIVMTACESSETLNKARTYGVSAYVNKPFDLDSLVELVQSASAGSVRREDKRSSNNTILFAKNQPVSLEILNGDTSGIFQSRIESRDDRALSLLAPVRYDEVVDIAPRTPVRVGLTANDAHYSFNSYVLARKITDVPLIVIDKPGVIYRTQRRQSVRIPVVMDVRYGKIASEDVSPESLADGKSCDISSSGIKIITATPFEIGDLVYLEADRSGTIGPITAIAEVMRANPGESDSEYVVAMRFKQVKGNFGNTQLD